MPICPFATWRPVPSHSGPMQAHLGLVLHVQVGDGSCYGEFAQPANQASSTWWVSKAGLLEQYVDSDMAAWTEMAGNGMWDSVETEGTPDQALTAAQVLTLARLFKWGADLYGWPYRLTDDVNGKGFGWHGMGKAAWGGHTGCPGDLRKAQRQAILDFAEVKSPPVAVPLTLTYSAEDDMAVFQYAFQEHTVTVDATGTLVHRYYQAPAPGAAATSWNREVLATGCTPYAKVGFDLAYAGALHLYADRPDGKQQHCWYAPAPGWASEVLT